MLAWPLTGRDEELERIAALVASGGVVLSGDAGVGKTRMAREVLARAGAQGAVTRWAAGTVTAAEIPLGAVAHLVALPQGGPLPSPFVLIRHAAERLVADAGGHPLVVGVDDAHLLDPLSATLVQQLALTGAARLVLTVRAGQPVCDTLVSLWKDEIFGRLELTALSRPKTARLMEAVLGGLRASAWPTCGTSLGATRCSSATWSKASWRPGACSRSPACGGGGAPWRRDRR